MDLSQLNDQQKIAVVESIKQSTVVLAGAGSGKTKTLTFRAGYLIDDMAVDPDKIMAVTFTNKAANEMKERLRKITPDVDKMWIGTFHSICVRILHMFGSDIGLNSFTIMDKSDAKNVLKQAFKDNNLPLEKQMINNLADKIGKYKSNLINPKIVLARAKDPFTLQMAQVYQTYQNLCWAQRVLDFDDLIVYTVILLQRSKRVRDWFEKNIQYLMVDESQDTNPAQFELVKLMIGDRNLFMVGKSLPTLNLVNLQEQGVA
jgi:DNA helicase-2/ATP-dependent DNA helicase PcrA